MLTKEERDRISDYFDPWDLAEFLKVDIRDFIEAFEDEIENALEDINEIMEFKDE